MCMSVCAHTRVCVCVSGRERERDSYVPWYPTRGQTAAVTTFIPLEPKRNAVKWPTPLLHKVASPEKPNCYPDLGLKYATRIRGISASFWKLRMLSVMWQKHMRLCRQTVADVSGCFILPYCHTESLSLRLPNDTWAAVYFCLHLYAQDPTLHIKSSCLQEEKMFILKNAFHIRCLGSAFLWGMDSQNSPFSEVTGVNLCN